MTTATTEKSPCGGGGQQCQQQQQQQQQQQAHRPRRKSLVMSLMDPSSIASNAAAAAIAIANSTSKISNNSQGKASKFCSSTTSGKTTTAMASGHIEGAEISDKENHLPPGEKRPRDDVVPKESSVDVDIPGTKSARAHEKSPTCSDTSPPPPLHPPAANANAIPMSSCRKIEHVHDVRPSSPMDKAQMEVVALSTNSEGSNNDAKNGDNNSNGSRTRTRQTMMRAAHLAMRSTWQGTAGDLTFDPSCKYCKSELVTATPTTNPNPESCTLDLQPPRKYCKSESVAAPKPQP
jgi:hypothetical protein